jgi:hypothetical protein
VHELAGVGDELGVRRRKHAAAQIDAVFEPDPDAEVGAQRRRELTALEHPTCRHDVADVEHLRLEPDPQLRRPLDDPVCVGRNGH